MQSDSDYDDLEDNEVLKLEFFINLKYIILGQR